MITTFSQPALPSEHYAALHASRYALADALAAVRRLRAIEPDNETYARAELWCVLLYRDLTLAGPEVRQIGGGRDRTFREDAE